MEDSYFSLSIESYLKGLSKENLSDYERSVLNALKADFLDKKFEEVNYLNYQLCTKQLSEKVGDITVFKHGAEENVLTVFHKNTEIYFFRLSPIEDEPEQLYVRETAMYAELQRQNEVLKTYARLNLREFEFETLRSLKKISEKNLQKIKKLIKVEPVQSLFIYNNISDKMENIINIKEKFLTAHPYPHGFFSKIFPHEKHRIQLEFTPEGDVFWLELDDAIYASAECIFHF